ncbi:unnamed protein product [Orchesella dallaii]|uniref:RING-type domain-containing protein n=1 Tax=Orchesella dallaii TaxID=48710 RepID=A0ABP1PTB1_9HEXA
MSEVIVNLESIPLKTQWEKKYYTGLLTFLRKFRRKTRKELRISDVLASIKEYDNYIYEVLTFATHRVAVYYYQNIRNHKKKTGRFYSMYNDDYVCVRNIVLLINEKKAPKPKAKPWHENFHQLIEMHFSCAICFDTLLEGVETQCNHRFCKACLANWKKLNSACPLCRQTLSTTRVDYHVNAFIDDVFKLFPKRIRDERRKRLMTSNIT